MTTMTTVAPKPQTAGSPPNRRKAPLSVRVPMHVSRLAWYLLCAVLAVSMIFPLLWMLSIALKSDTDINQLPPDLLPKEFIWSNFIDGPKQINFLGLLGNTVTITVLVTVGAVLSSMLVGYGLARVEFTGRKVWFYVFTCSIFLPGIVGMIPLVRLYIAVHLYDSWWPLILPAFLGNPIFTFLARQYFMTIPMSIDEAATIDGAGHWRIFTRIMFPLTKPLWITMAVMSFQGAWNDYLSPLIYLTTDSKYPLSLGMAQFSGSFAGVSVTPYNYYMATNFWYMLPPLVLFFLAQRYFMTGLGSLGGGTK
ncbi:carbohydrate ABC transporter permease [Microlunatus elymi]|nr:carbohydrate ABC transporter permease [Microlunatus elymi]